MYAHGSPQYYQQDPALTNNASPHAEEIAMILSRKEQIHRDQQLAKQNESYVRAPLPHEQELWVVDTNEELVMNTPYGSTAIGGVYRKPVTPREARIGNSVRVN
jgi:hypothetical protein